MTDYELGATFRVFERAGAGEHLAYVVLRGGPGELTLVELATERPLVAGRVFRHAGLLWRVLAYREAAELWDAEPAAQ